jgi:anti-sigma B factor antagonist
MRETTMSAPVHLSTLIDRERAIVRLAGAVDVSSANELANALTRLADDDVQSVVVDVTGAELADSAALAALVIAQKQARRRGGDLVIAGAGEETRRVLALTGLDRSFRLVPSTT